MKSRTSTVMLWTTLLSTLGSSAVVDVPPGDASIRYLGRFAKVAGGAEAQWSWSGSGAAITFSGTACSIRMQAQGSLYGVLVDGKETKVLDLSKPSSDTLLVLATGLAQGTHTVAVRQRTEAQYSTTRFKGFRIEGTPLVAAPVGERRIEFYGNSITCGYGILDSVAGHPFQVQTEHEGLTFAALAADSVGAERHTICWSGRGVIQNYGGDTKSPTVPQLSARSLGGDASSVWDFSTWIPQVVVIDLGTNDYSTASAQPDSAKFFRTYLAFVDTLHARYPQARFVLVDGPMMSDGYPAGLNTLSKLKSHIKNIVADAAKRGIQATHLSLTSQNDTRGYGADYHPNRAQARLNGAELAAHLGEAMPEWKNASLTHPTLQPKTRLQRISSGYSLFNDGREPLRAWAVGPSGATTWKATLHGQAGTDIPGSRSMRWLILRSGRENQILSLPPELR